MSDIGPVQTKIESIENYSPLIDNKYHRFIGEEILVDPRKFRDILTLAKLDDMTVNLIPNQNTKLTVADSKRINIQLNDKLKVLAIWVG
jgi:hypothetical protein